MDRFLEIQDLRFQEATVEMIRNVLTPFKVEFARKSLKRSDAPTLVPVENGGAR